MEVLNQINQALQALGQGVTLDAALALAAAGTIAMAVIQVIKEVTPVRRRFQRAWMMDWFRRRLAAFEASLERAGKPVGKADIARLRRQIGAPEAVNHGLVDLATGGADDAFYDLATEQLVAQMNAAAQMTLDYPARYGSVLVVLSQGAALEDVARVLQGAPPADAGAAPDTRQFLDARTRVGHRIQRNLDAVQIALGARWRFWMQISSIAIATLVVELAVAAKHGASPETFAVALLLGVIGGYLGPVTRDLVAALQSLRR